MGSGRATADWLPPAAAMLVGWLRLGGAAAWCGGVSRQVLMRCIALLDDAVGLASLSLVLMRSVAVVSCSIEACCFGFLVVLCDVCSSAFHVLR